MSFKILTGDSIEVVRGLPDNSVHCCITSPPYWGLRDYGTASWIGGTQNCDHKDKPMRTRSGVNCHTGTGVDKKNASLYQPMKDVCTKCGAVRVDSQIGLETTPEIYVSRIVDVFREISRVLRKDGTLWLNLGDSYAGGGKGGGGSFESNRPGWSVFGRTKGCRLKPKDLVGIPWRVAFALQEDGWWLRQDIIWHKPNPMPESVRDRCTKSHEYLFLLSKSEKYYFNSDAIKEPALYAGRSRGGSKKRYEQNDAGMDCKIYNTRNKRSVWTVQPKPFPESHFATFPPLLIEPCILAGCPEGGTVLDPFSGAGTTGVVSVKHGRSYIGIELNPNYVDMSIRRINKEFEKVGLFDHVQL